MSDLQYVFEKGRGWIPRVGVRILTAEDCAGQWFKLEDNTGYLPYKFPIVSYEIINDWVNIDQDWAWVARSHG